MYIKHCPVTTAFGHQKLAQMIVYVLISDIIIGYPANSDLTRSVCVHT